MRYSFFYWKAEKTIASFHKLFLASSLLLIFTCANAQRDSIRVHYYLSTANFLDNQLSEDVIILVPNQIGKDFIYVKDIRDPATGKRSKDGYKAWAIEYQGNKYIHLNNSYNSKLPGLFIQVDVTGRFCMAVMEPGFDKSMKQAAPYYGAGLSGVLMHESATWGGNFQDSLGREVKIFLADTKDRSIVYPYKADNSPCELLTGAKLKWLTGKDDFKGRAAYTVEEIIALVEYLNSHQKN